MITRRPKDTGRFATRWSARGGRAKYHYQVDTLDVADADWIVTFVHAPPTSAEKLRNVPDIK